MIKLIGLFLSVFSSLAAGEQITFKLGGKEVKSLDTTELTQHAASVKVFEHLSETEATYLATPFRELLESVYGAHWGESGEELLFTCVDGYQPSIPLSVFKANKSFLALAKPGEDFKATTSKDNKSISLGPTYLIWENLKNLEIREKAGSIWPYQVVAVDLIKFKDRFGKMAPRENASAAVNEGFLIFREKCMSCHKMNGEGAPTGIDLNNPVPKIQMYNPKWFGKWILEPKTLRPETSMPGLKSSDPKAAQHIKPLLKYLESMAQAAK